MFAAIFHLLVWMNFKWDINVLAVYKTELCVEWWSTKQDMSISVLLLRLFLLGVNFTTPAFAPSFAHPHKRKMRKVVLILSLVGF